jgi:hypothetical protein
MQRRFCDYTHLYSARDFEPQLPEIVPTPALECFFYWSGDALMWIAFPIKLSTALCLARRVRKKGLARP